jgi:ABC-type lipoprotein release transport system permease subunit
MYNWLFFVSRRFARVDRRSRSLATGFLSSLGICFGVMTLIVTLSVMNGFQRLSIDAIMEISSYHVRYTESYGGEVSPLGSALRSSPHPSLPRFSPSSLLPAPFSLNPAIIAAVPFLEGGFSAVVTYENDEKVQERFLFNGEEIRRNI